jgi:hypothetical protein
VSERLPEQRRIAKPVADGLLNRLKISCVIHGFLLPVEPVESSISYAKKQCIVSSTVRIVKPRDRERTTLR